MPELFRLNVLRDPGGSGVIIEIWRTVITDGNITHKKTETTMVLRQARSWFELVNAPHAG